MTRRTAAYSLILVIALAAMFAGWYLIEDFRLIAEKAATRWVMPYGFVWLLLTALLIYAIRTRMKAKQAWIQRTTAESAGSSDFGEWIALERSFRRLSWGLAVIWLLMYLAGNGVVAKCLMRQLDREFVTLDISQQPSYDAVILLGGGTTTRPNRQPQLNVAGDRIVTAARLYQTGKAKKIICTGSRVPGLDRIGIEQSQLAMSLLEELGVPSHAMTAVGGRNTSVEMAKIAEMFEDDQQLGLLTSAWHLDRASRLARRQGLETSPIPADFRTPPDMTPTLFDFIPQARAAWTNALVAKEWLARCVGR